MNTAIAPAMMDGQAATRGDHNNKKSSISSFTGPNPSIVRITSAHGLDGFCGLGAEIFLIYFALLVDDECHHTGVAPFCRPSNQRKAADHPAILA